MPSKSTASVLVVFIIQTRQAFSKKGSKPNAYQEDEKKHNF
jgi:hypothetical protein